MLDIKDPVVANCLIDQRHIEYVLLADSSDAGTNLMMSRQSGRYNQLFTVAGDHMFSQPCYRCYLGNGGRSQYLSVKVEELVLTLESEKSKASEALQRAREQKQETELERRRNEKVKYLQTFSKTYQ